MTRPPIVLLTDFGLADAYVGVVKGVILSRDPAATLIDLCHDVGPQDVREGAFLLMTSVPYFPPGSVFLAVVDPGVGSARRALALETAGYRFVAPDNGLLSWCLRALGERGDCQLEVDGSSLRPGAGAKVVELTESRFWLPAVISTFHGRDVFGPVAASLSLGQPLDTFGPAVDAMVNIPWPEPRQRANGIVGEVIHVDRYGTLVTNLRPGDLPPRPGFELGGWTVQGLSSHFQSDQPLVALVGSSGFVELAAPNASAAALTGATRGATLIARSRRT